MRQISARRHRQHQTDRPVQEGQLPLMAAGEQEEYISLWAVSSHEGEEQASSKWLHFPREE